MSIVCDVWFEDTASPEQLMFLGSALWDWCVRVAGDSGVYQHVDNQALADLIAGKLPLPREADRRGGHLWVRDQISPDSQATIDSLRREIPARGVKDIQVDGTSWNAARFARPAG
jgi:hypothetical protein